MKKITEIKSLDELNEAVKKNTNPLTSIRLKCLDCSVYELTEVRNCTVTTCPLFSFRLGKNPFRKNNLTDEQREKMRERMKQLKNK